MATELEGQLAEVRVREQQAIDELTKTKDDWDATIDRLGKSEILVAELRQRVAHSKKLAVEDFKSLDFQDAIETATSKYFGEGFDFYKRQLHRHNLDLAIDLKGMGLNHDLLEEEEEEEELKEKQEKEKEEKKEEKENEEKKEEKEKKEGEDTNPFSP